MGVIVPLLWLGRGGVLLLGLVWLTVLLHNLACDTELFTDPRFEHFWADIQAHHLKTEGWKTSLELARDYGVSRITDYVLTPGWGGMILPSEDAVTATIIGATIAEIERAKRDGPAAGLDTIPLARFFILFLVMFAPIIYAVRTVQRAVTWGLCQTRAAKLARMSYFAALEWRVAAWSMPGALALAAILALVNGSLQHTPAMEAQGISVGKLTEGLLWAGYAGGIWVLLTSCMIDAVVIALGINPHHTLLDDVLVLAIIAPAMVLLYQNTWITVITSAVTGLAGSLVAKYIARRRNRGVREAGPYSMRDASIG